MTSSSFGSVETGGMQARCGSAWLLAFVVIAFGITMVPDGAVGPRMNAIRLDGAAVPEPSPQAVADPFLLRVTTHVDRHPNLGVPGKILVDGILRDEWGLAWLKLPPGPHTVSFTDIANLGTPADVSFVAEPGSVVEVRGVYRAKGWLRVVTDPPVAATISVDGVPRDDWGVWMAVPPGIYEVSFGAVEGYRPPSPQTVEVRPEELTWVVGSYVYDGVSPGPDPASHGLLRVTTRLGGLAQGVWTQILVDGVSRDEWGIAWLKLAPGWYTLTFSDVWNVGTPAPQTFTITAGETTTLEGVFEPRGWLRVKTDPPLPGTILVDGIPRNDWGIWQSVPAGTYEVSFGEVAGYPAPSSQLVTVAVGEVTTVTGSYAAPLYSLNWAGYVAATDFTAPSASMNGVVGSWIVPTVRPSSPAVYSAAWVGIGGFFSGDMTLIQVGTSQDSRQGSAYYWAWYEMLPAAAVPITNRNADCPVTPGTSDCLVRPGDVIAAGVVPAAGTDRWRIVLQDVTHGWSFDLEVTYASSRRSAEWIVERPFVCIGASCTLTTLADFGTIDLGSGFTAVPATNAALILYDWVAIGAGPHRVVVMTSGAVILAHPTDLSANGSSFSVHRS